MIFADKMIALRKKNGWSQEELAEKMNVTRQAVSKWEGAQSVPDLEKILLLSQLFGVSTDYLLKDELGEAEYVADTEELPAPRRVTMEEAGEFLRVKEQTAKTIAFATFLCILSPLCLMLLGAASVTGLLPITENFAAGMGLIVLFLLVAAAVALFIASGAKTSPYQFLEHEPFETEYGVTGMVRERQKQCREACTRFNVLGTCICILSVIPLFAGVFLPENVLFMAVMLCVTIALAGVGVMLLITAGIQWDSLQKLLQEGSYSRQNKRGAALAGALGTMYWLLVTAGFLAYSFATDDWKGGWIVWPVAGVLYAALMTGCGALRKKG